MAYFPEFLAFSVADRLETVYSVTNANERNTQ